jgi:FMN phosphatase YigB (HAD superfamily)
VVDAFVSSVDVGFNKPHPAVFEAASAAISCPPPACVVIGNSEPNDIVPAAAVGMRALRVAIEEPLPESSAAHAVAGSLAEAEAILRAWVSR